MSLNWDLTDCKLDEEWKKENWISIESMIWLTMAIDVGKITTGNLKMIEFRLRCYSKIHGQNVDHVIAILPKLVGLNVNVHTISDAAFGKKAFQMLTDEIKRELRYIRLDKEKKV